MLTVLRLLRADSVAHALLWLAVLCIFVGGCNQSAKTEALFTDTEGAGMVTLSIDFQDGFADDTIVLQINGEEVFRKEHVSTSLLLGLACSWKGEVKKGPVTVEVKVQTRNISRTVPLNVSAGISLGISVVNDRIEHIISDKPFGYF